MLLAEISSLEIEIASLIVSLVVGIGGIVLGIVVAARKQAIEVSPDPISVKMIERLVTKEDFSEHAAHNERTHQDIFKKIGGVERGAASTLENNVSQIWNEVRQQGKCVAGLQKETELQNQTLAAVQTDIKVILGRLPRSSNEH